MQDLSAFVLAGGRSSRLGRDKALVTLGDRNFLQIALDNARAVCPAPIIVGASSLYAEFGEVIEDRIPGCGPLGGIHAALSATPSDLNLVLSVDMPLMDSNFLKWLAKQAAETTASVTVPLSGGRLQPLCAVYRRTILPQIKRPWHEGNIKLRPPSSTRESSKRAKLQSPVLLLTSSATSISHMNTNLSSGNRFPKLLQ